MKAVVIERPATAARLLDYPEPSLEDGAVLVRINVAGVNPIDWKMRDAKAGDHVFPFVLGQDFSGVVERIAAGVTRVEPGDRVFGFAREHGAYAEKTLVPESAPLSLIPSALGDDRAAALPTAALTALASLNVLDIKGGSSLLVLGGAGAVGGAAVQIAHHRGAHVTAYVRPGQESEARAFGADVVVSGSGDVRAAVRAARGEPFEAVLDVISDADALKRNALLVRPGGRLVTTIHVADVPWFAESGIAATNLSLVDTADYSGRGLDELAKMAVNGTLVVNVAGERSLEEANDLLDGIEAGKISGKFVLRVAGA